MVVLTLRREEITEIVVWTQTVEMDFRVIQAAPAIKVKQVVRGIGAGMPRPKKILLLTRRGLTIFTLTAGKEAKEGKAGKEASAEPARREVRPATELTALVQAVLEPAVQE